MNKLTHSETKRYNLVLPIELFDGVQRIAEKESTTFLEIIRRFIKIGLLIYENPKSEFFVRKDGAEQLIAVVII